MLNMSIHMKAFEVCTNEKTLHLFEHLVPKDVFSMIKRKAKVDRTVWQARNQGGGEAHPRKFSPLLEKCVGYSLKILDVVNIFGPLSENSSPLLVSQASYGPAAWHVIFIYTRYAYDDAHNLCLQYSTCIYVQSTSLIALFHNNWELVDTWMNAILRISDRATLSKS